MTYNQLTTEEFIKRAREIHGDKYDYSKAKYIDSKTPICIICPEHGEFWQISSVHFRGGGCPRCTRANNKLTMEEFIKKAREVHGNKYDYSKVENFSRVIDKVTIICPEHGEFKQRINCHLSGSGCPHCVHKSITMTTESFIERSKEIHGNKYDYSKTEYKGSTENICIICPEHGEFWQNPSTHLRGHGCPSCGGVAQPTIEEFITRAKNIHGNKYDYSRVVYKNYQTPVCIICPEHGEFWQSPASHLNGSGCPNCHGLRKDYKFNLLQEFESEYEFRAFLENNDINILQVILRNVEPKYEPLKRDIERALANAEEVNPIDYLEQKYTNESDEEENEGENNIDTGNNTIETVINSVDLDDDDAVTSVLTLVDESKKPEGAATIAEPTIEQVIENTAKELKVIERIEHMLTPEDREYIMDKFLNDKRREWMAARAI